MKIKWQDKVSNNEVLEHSNTPGVQAIIMTAQLRWSGHILRMEDCRLPKKILYGELKEGTRSRGDQKKRFKDKLKQNLKKCNIDLYGWETPAANRPIWRSAVTLGVAQFEEQRPADRDTRRRRRKDQTSRPTAAHISQFVCSTCGRDCHSRIGLFSHDKVHK